ncbi:hypothetical protein CO655_31460 [Rhizobium sp. M1]|nr:hypothetical protein CO655_31460 [Rhizobium sp. M1]
MDIFSSLSADDWARTLTSPSLIPVLVTGIQPRRVRAVKEPVLPRKESFAPKDLGALDSCDKHRNEGGETTARNTHAAPSRSRQPKKPASQGQPAVLPT